MQIMKYILGQYPGIQYIGLPEGATPVTVVVENDNIIAIYFLGDPLGRIISRTFYIASTLHEIPGTPKTYLGMVELNTRNYTQVPDLGECYGTTKLVLGVPFSGTVYHVLEME